MVTIYKGTIKLGESPDSFLQETISIHKNRKIISSFRS